MATLQRGLRVDPLHPVLHATEGWALVLLGRWHEALAAFQRATELDPSHAGALFYRGALHSLEGRLDLAVTFFRRALEADPGHAFSLAGLSSSYLWLDDLDEAGGLVERLATLAPGAGWSARTRLGLHAFRGERGPMLEAAREILAFRWVDSGFAAALQVLTLADVEAGRHVEALNRYSDRLPGLFEDPSELALKRGYDAAVSSAVDLAALMQTMGDEEAAERLLDRCLAAFAADPRPTSPLRVFNPLAEPALHALRGDKQAALAALRSAIGRGWLVESEGSPSSGGWRSNPRLLLLHPHLRILHDEPEFQAMVEEVEADLARMRQALEERDQAQTDL